MNCFKILGIEATDDKELVKKAYKKLLPSVHPEEDPEGFQRLRQAYEEALGYEARPDGKEAEEDLSDLDLWIAKVKAVYEDFEKRLSLDAWQELLDEDVCFAIDTAAEANKRLLEYFMYNYYVPHEVLRLLEAHLGWEERRKELCDIFPEGFIDYLISNAKFEDSFRYYAFDIEPDRDYETFVGNYFYLLNNLYNSENTEKEEVLKKMCLMGIEHPDFMVLRIRYALVSKDLDKANEIKDAALERYKDDERIMYAAAQIALAFEDYEAAMDYATKILEIDPNHIGAKIAEADALYGFKRYEDALEKYKSLSDILAYDNYLSDATHKTYAALAQDYKEKLEKEPADDGCRMLYLDAAINSYQFEQAEEEAIRINAANVDAYTYNLYMGRLYNGLDEHETALTYYEQALELFHGDDDERADLIVDRALQYERTEKYGEALELYDAGLLLYPDFDRLNYRKAAVLNQLNRSKEALDLCEKALRKKETPNAYHYKAEALYLLKEYGEALHNCDLSIERIPYYATYKIKLETLFELRKFDDILELMKYLRHVGLATAEALIMEGKALIELGRYEEAEKILNEAREQEQDNKEVFYQLALVYWYKTDYQKSLDTLLLAEGEVKDLRGYFYFLGNLYMRLDKLDEAEKIYTALLKKLEDAQDYINCRLGALYKKRKDYVKAVEFYKKAMEANPSHSYANGEIADIYEACGDYKPAFKYNALQLERDPSDYYYIQRGILYGHMNEAEKELESYLLAYEMNPNNSFANSNIGLCHMKQGRPEEAIKYYERAIELNFPYPDAYINIALCLSRIGRNEDAYGYFDKGFEKYPDRHWILRRKGQTLRNNHLFNEAIEVFLRYIEISGEQLEGYEDIGDTYRLKGDTERAITWYEKIKKIDKSSEASYSNIGWAWYKKGNYKKALYYLKKAVEKDKDHANNFECLGDVYAKLGKKEKAKENYKKSLELRLKELEDDMKEGDERPCTYNYAADLYRKLGQAEKAKEMFEKAFAMAAGYKYCYRMGCYEGYYGLGLLYEEEGDIERARLNFEAAYKLQPDREYEEAVKRTERHN